METGFIFFRRNQNRTETGLQASCILLRRPIWASLLFITVHHLGCFLTGWLIIVKTPKLGVSTGMLWFLVS